MQYLLISFINLISVSCLLDGGILVYTAISFIIEKSALASSDKPDKVHNSGTSKIGPVIPDRSSFDFGFDINNGCFISLIFKSYCLEK